MPRLFAPLARLYAAAALKRLRRPPCYRSRLPVVCVGNFTAGGTGKTPFAIHVVRLLQAAGERPAILTRGYGGRLAGPHWIDPSTDTAASVGDEPLLLARVAPTMLARDRRAGATAIECAHAPAPSVIVMDDGLQNPALAKDLTIALVDARRGFGNGRVIPAGPLRAPVEEQLARVDAILVKRDPSTAEETTTTPNAGAAPRGESDGLDCADTLHSLRLSFAGPVLSARVAPIGDTAWIDGRAVLAYTGIANPRRFFDLVARLGGRIVDRAAFKDHHPFTEREARDLMARALACDAVLVTTEKDLVRLAGIGGARGDLRQASRALPIGVVLDPGDAPRLDDLLADVRRTGGYRSWQSGG